MLKTLFAHTRNRAEDIHKLYSFLFQIILFRISYFGHLYLFRVSCFVFRASRFLFAKSWHILFDELEVDTFEFNILKHTQQLPA